MTFARPATNRHIDFSEIASKTSIPLNEVELLTMKAMSLGLVRGTIDQVSGSDLVLRFKYFYSPPPPGVIRISTSVLLT